MTPFALKITRAVFAFLDPVAPRLAGRLAFELFQRTPSRSRMSEREKRINADARSFMASARRHCLITGYGRVTAHEFRPETGRPRRSVLVIHGWGSRSEHMRPIVERLLAEGIRVVALDLPGHGASAGRRLNMAMAVAAASTTEQWLGPFTAIVGHSFGGAVALNSIAGSIEGIQPVAANRLVLISAPSSMPSIFQDFGRFLRLGTATQTAIAENIRQLTGRNLEDFVGSDQLRRLCLPTLVIHAPDDKEVDFSNALAFEKAGEHVSLMRLSGLGHRRILGDDRVSEQTVAFVSEGGESSTGQARLAAAAQSI